MDGFERGAWGENFFEKFSPQKPGKPSSPASWAGGKKGGQEAQPHERNTKTMPGKREGRGKNATAGAKQGNLGVLGLGSLDLTLGPKESLGQALAFIGKTRK